MKARAAYQKLSKKEQREIDRAGRKGWGAISPVTRRSENPRAYDRQKARRLERDSEPGPLLFFARGV